MLNELPVSRAAVETLLDRSQPAAKRTIASTYVRRPLVEDDMVRLVEHLEHADEGEAFNIADVLARNKSKKATKSLLGILRSNAADHVKIAIIHALQRIRDKRSVRTLDAIVANPINSEALRAKACDGLSVFARRPFVRRRLLAGLRDPSANVRYYCLVALRGALETSLVRQAILPLQHDDSTTWEGIRISEVAKRFASQLNESAPS